MKNTRNKGTSILIVLICLFYTTNSYSQDYSININEASSTDLGYYNVKGSTFEYNIFFDSFNKKVAYQAIPHLSEMYKEVLKFFKIEKESINWADVAFVNNEDYKAPAMGNTRWVIQNQDSKELSSLATDEIYELIAHEQVHALQQQFGACQQLPRWFTEGQAVWIESKVLSSINPETWEETLLFLMKEYDKAVKNGEEIPVEDWGGMGFSIDAVKKQLTPEGIKYLEKHGRTPPGVTISLTPEDIKDDHSITLHAANYYKSYLIFKDIEDDIGTQELIHWNSEILEQCFDSNQIINSLKSKYGLDISEKLK